VADIAAGRVDIIVVYKVDRLTRSLLDFAKLVEVFDKAGVSFVSITQSFNTTTSKVTRDCTRPSSVVMCGTRRRIPAREIETATVEALAAAFDDPIAPMARASIPLAPADLAPLRGRRCRCCGNT
jgi:hypothetical protein